MRLILPALLLSSLSVFGAEPTTHATTAINGLGIDLLHQTHPGANALLSPYSIQSALAMTYAGADGATRAEMAKVLRYPSDNAELHRSFAGLREALEGVMQKSVKDAERMQQRGGRVDPITLTTANRLFGQTGFAFREPFLELVKSSYAAPFVPLDFRRNSSAATKHINGWVGEQTRERIRNLIPDGALNQGTRLVLVNAIYLKAPWEHEFYESATRPQPFYLGANNLITVTSMRSEQTLGYAKHLDFTAVMIPYRGGELQFLVLLPDKVDGLADLEKKLTADLLGDFADAKNQKVILHLPKFKLEPPAMTLSRSLQALGMRSAFDKPPRSANFDRMAPRTPDDYLFVSEVFHKTFLNLDEKGTEAAAATAVAMVATNAAEWKPAKPIEVRVDRPFLFAIQHRASGACLFLGRVNDPR
ncbi:MAG TPA: serpin family protein [Verrucomicrobiae bacterium]|nr:serpin family protein [Verrucomicrobiae bacterium]